MIPPIAIKRKENEMTPANVACWFELPVSDLKRAANFYNQVLKTELRPQQMGPNVTAVFPTADNNGVGGHLYEGKTPPKGTGPTVHLVAPDKLEDAMARVFDNGGEVVSPVVEIPAGRFAYCLDPDGNSFGLFTA